MRRARATFMNPDFSISELGEVDADAALATFDSIQWIEALENTRSLAERGEASADPDITFTIEKVHLAAAAKAPDLFNIEVCVPRVRRLLGLFSGVKFYQVRELDRARVGQAIRTFMTQPHEVQHALFSELARSAA